ncbi:MAG TPA: outer membrane beta-barrel protein [Vicinamibacteria bacterium]
MTKLESSFVAAVIALSAAALPARADDEGRGGLAAGRVELSTAASFTNLKEGGGDESFTVLSVPLRVGYLVTKNFGLEGEVLATHVDFGGDDSDNGTGALFSANALYHFNPEGRTSPFLLVGGGVGNAEEFLNIAYKADRTVTAFHAGAGVKAFLNRRAALRLEYRFSRYSGGERSTGFFTSEDPSTSLHKVLVGISVFFR